MTGVKLIEHHVNISEPLACGIMMIIDHYHIDVEHSHDLSVIVAHQLVRLHIVSVCVPLHWDSVRGECGLNASLAQVRHHVVLRELGCHFTSAVPPPAAL